jgi:uncharacterized phiE125 gp8 family phage protein
VITLTEAKNHLKVEADEQESDGLIESLVQTATVTIENLTRRTIVSGEKTAVFDGFLPTIKLPWWPVQSIVSVQYFSVDGAELAFADYDMDARSIPAKIMPRIDESWPQTRDNRMSVKVTASVGYEVVPAPLKSAALLLISHLFENRESVVVGAPVASLPMGFEMLIASYVIYRVA